MDTAHAESARRARAASRPRAADQRVQVGHAAAMPARDLLALQRSVGNLATARMVQRYIDEKYPSGTWRQSDDLTLATKAGYPNHELYARPGKAAQANA